MITDADVRRYREDGYLLLRGTLGPKLLRALRTGTERLLAAWSQTGDSYERILHQIHHPWRLDPDVASVVTDPCLAQVAGRLAGMDEVAVFLDQIIVKPPGGAATIAHQDAPFLSFDDERSLGCWIALDEVTGKNGRLGYFSGSHRLGPLPPVHLDENENLLDLVPALRELPLRWVDMAPGDVVLHNCRTVHQAGPNSTGGSRRAFSIQYMPLHARYNGYRHEFLDPYEPTVGSPLDQECFSMPRAMPRAAREPMWRGK